jgi:cytochrome b subunit of formate dehydrogenase
MAGSFVVLTYSGFALTYPEAWWAVPLQAWEDQYDIRGWVHRIAALVMLASALIHVVHLAVDRKARACIWQFIPGRGDLHELKERAMYFLGRQPDPPKSPWVGYPEKMEYGGVVWGTVVMTVTGFALWFENIVLRWFPSWVMDLSTTIHFWEAVLAGLSILVWHLYAVVFDPVVYPMDPAWLTGRSAPGREHERLAPEEPSSDTEEDQYFV